MTITITQFLQSERSGAYAILFILISKLSTIRCMGNLKMKYCIFTLSEAMKESQGKD